MKIFAIFLLFCCSTAFATKKGVDNETWVQLPSIRDGLLEEEIPIKISRKFDKGYNSTSVMEGKSVDLFCEISRGGNTTRYKVIWRILDVYIDPNSDHLNKTQFTYTETPTLTKLIINSATLDHPGWYQCALWDVSLSSVNASFDPKYIVARFETRLRVKAEWAWVYPVCITAAELIILIVFLVIILNFNLLNPDGLEEEDYSDPELDNKDHKHHLD